MKTSKENLNFVSVATKQYLEFWKEQARSIDIHLAPETGCQLILFTDKPSKAKDFSQELANVQVRVLPIPSYGWPEATLLRYRWIKELAKSLSADDLLIYLDSDMLAVSQISYRDFFPNEAKSVTLVRHPGYYRPSWLPLLHFYTSNPKVALLDFATWAAKGGLGAWETRNESQAFVERKQRNTYYCGGIWWGPAKKVLELCDELALRIDQDSSNGVMAVWHDESHLNWWATTHGHTTESPEYCFSPDFPALNKLNPKFVAVDKGVFSRVKTEDIE